jgi:hypothetical protein
MTTHDDPRWLHDIDPPFSHRGLVVAMFLVTLLCLGLGVTGALWVRDGMQQAEAAVTARVHAIAEGRR